MLMGNWITPQLGMDKFTIWNVRGLNDLEKRRKVKDFISYHKIQLFSLLETRVKRANLGNIYLSLCPDWNLISNHAHHYNGRIIVAWNPHVFTIDVLVMTDQFIHTEILVNATRMKFLCTFVYGQNNDQKRNCLWNFLSDTAAAHSKPWCVGGDFNAIMHYDDRTGSIVREKDIRPMANCMHQCRLHDVKSIGRFYTWNNKQDGCNRILSKIDRFLSNQLWETTFQEAIVHFCPEGDFDHSPMVITTVKVHHGHKPFKFYNHWVNHDLFTQTVKYAWHLNCEGTRMFKVIQKLKKLKPLLKAIDGRTESSLAIAFKDAKTSLLQAQEALHQNPSDPNLAHEEKIAAVNFQNTKRDYQMILMQKAKLHWLREGDENTRLFHNYIKGRKKNNLILALHDMDGKWVDTPNLITNSFIDFYTHLLGTTMESRCGVYDHIIKQGRCLESNQHLLLDCIFSQEDIKKAVFSINKNKAPGLDGYNSAFFQHSWDIIGDEISWAIQDAFRSRKLLREINITAVTLIPKVNVPKSVKDYRPIACCTIIYKCITKLICSQLGKVLPSVISSNQGAFVSGRNIIHNVLLCQDLVKLYRPSQKQRGCLMKLDITKAYDTVEWSFIEDMLTHLGFPTHFIEMVMTCITTPAYSLLINGNPTPLILPKRGLRQGDPLSPLLFTLCMEYGTRILQQAANIPGFKFHPRCKSLRLNNLWFADDMLLFCRGDIDSIAMMISSLKLFSETTGLQISAEKSEIYLAGMTSREQEMIGKFSGFRIGKLPFTYLGVPMDTKKITPRECEVLIDKMCKRIKLWSSRNLSYSGRLQLVNSILTSICTYWTQIFILPKTVITKINSVCQHFL